MRNFSSTIDLSYTFVLDGSTTFTSSEFVRVQQALMIAMDANPKAMCPSEDAVLDDFIGWVLHNLDAEGANAATNGKVLKPVFVYHNLNEGHSVAVIWSDAKGKVSYVGNASQLRLWSDQQDLYNGTGDSLSKTELYPGGPSPSAINRQLAKILGIKL